MMILSTLTGLSLIIISAYCNPVPQIEETDYYDNEVYGDYNEDTQVSKTYIDFLTIFPFWQGLSSDDGGLRDLLSTGGDLAGTFASLFREKAKFVNTLLTDQV